MPNKINLSRNFIKEIAFGGIITAVLFIFTFLVAIPVGYGGYISISDILLFYLAVLYRKYPIFIIAILSYSLADLARGAAQYIPATILSRLFIILSIWLIVNKNCNNYFVYLLTCIIGQCFLVFIYFIWDFFVLKQCGSYTTVNFTANIIQMTVITIFAPIITYYLKQSNFHKYALKKLSFL